MKWVKRLLAAVGVVVLIFVVAAVVLALTFDPNDYKQRIAQAVEQTTGRTLSLEGDIELSFFPWLGVELGEVTLGNAKGFGESPFAHVDDAAVSVKVLPLFTGEIEARTVRLEGMTLNLSKNEQGVGNWEDLVPEAGAQPEEQPAEQPSRVTALAIGGIEIEDASIHWQDAQAGTDLRVAPVNLNTGAIELGEPFELDLTAHLRSQSPPLEADVSVDSDVTLDPKAQRYRLADLELAVKAAGESLPGGKLEAALTTNLVADLVAGTVTVKPVTLKGPLTLEGQLKATQLNTAPRVEGALKSQSFNPRELMMALGMQPPATSDPDVLKRAKLDVAYEATADSATLSKLSARLDDTEITGEGAIRSFDKPKITFKLALDAMDLDRYTPPEPEGAPAQEQPKSAGKPPASADDRLELPVETLRGLNMDGSLTAGKLKVSNLRFNDTRATMTAKDGLVQLKPFATALYKGRIDGQASVDVRKETPVFGAKTELKGVEIGPLSVDLLGREQAYIRGTSRLALDLNTRGARISALKQRLGGNFSFAVDDGALRDEKLARTVERVVAFLKGREPAEPGKELIFDALTGSAVIDEGVARNDDLKLKTPLIAAGGQGTIDIGQSTIDYKLSVGLPGSLEKGGRQVPLTVKGSLEDPSYSVDLAGLIGKEQKEKLQQKKQELEKKLDEKKEETLKGLEDKAKEKLKDKFNF